MQPEALKSWASFSATFMFVYVGCAVLVVLLSMSVECCRHTGSSPGLTQHTNGRPVFVSSVAPVAATVIMGGGNLLGQLLYPQVGYYALPVAQWKALVDSGHRLVWTHGRANY